MRSLYVVVSLILLLSHAANAQFTSVIDGNWHDGATWGNTSPGVEGVDYPGAGSDATIFSNVTVATGTANVRDLNVGAFFQLTVNIGATLSLNRALFIDDDGAGGNGYLVVDGTLRANQGSSFTNDSEFSVTVNGTYTHNFTTTNGNIILATWGPASTAQVVGYTTNTNYPGNLNQTFNNFTWNTPLFTGATFMTLDGNLANVAGTLTFTSTGTNRTLRLFGDALSGLTMTVGQDFIINGNARVVGSIQGTNNGVNIGRDFLIQNSTASVSTLTVTGAVGFTVNRNFVMSGPASGTNVLNLATGVPTNVGIGFLNLKGNFTIGPNCTIAKGANTNITGDIRFNGVSPTVQNFVNTGATFTNVRMQIENQAIVNMSTYPFTGAGAFWLQAGGNLQVGSPDGLNIGSTLGNVRNSGAHVYDATANIVYNGTAGNQNLGTEWSSTGALGAVAVNLEINKPSGQSVINNNNGSTNVVGNITLTSGTLSIGGNNSLSINKDFTAVSGNIAGTTTSSLSFATTGTFSGNLTFASGGRNLNNFTIARSGTYVLGSALTVNGTLAFSSSGNLRLNGNRLTVNGDITQSGSGAITSTSGTSSLVIAGAGTLSTVPFCGTCGANQLKSVTLARSGVTYPWSSTVTIVDTLALDAGTLNHTTGLTMSPNSVFRRSTGASMTGSPVLYTGPYNLYYVGNHTSTGMELPSATNALNTLTTAGDVALSSAVTINGTLNVTAGVLSTVATNTPITMAGTTFGFNGGTLNISSPVNFTRPGGTVAISGSTVDNIKFNRVNISANTTVSAPNFNINVAEQWNNNGIFTPNTGTVTFNGTSAQSINSNGQPFYNFSTSGAGVKTLTSALDVNNDLHITASSNLAADTYPINIAGLWNNEGTFNANTGTVIFDGTTQTIDNNGQSFYALTFANSGTKTLDAAVRATNALSINSGVTLDVSSNNYGLNVGGTWTNNGTFAARNGTVTFDGTINQSIGGTTNTQFFNIVQTNNTQISFASAQSMQNALTISAGQFNPNNNFTMLSTATRTARINALGAGASISTTTNMTVQRYIANTSGARARRYLASPVTNAFAAGWKDDTPITGPWADHSTQAEWPGLPAFNATGNNMWVYNEAKTPSSSINDRYDFFPASNTTLAAAPLVNGRGYVILVRQTTPIADMELVGRAAWGNVPVTVTNQAGGANDGWNLIGNPYPSPISWNNVTKPAGLSDWISFNDNTNAIGLGEGASIYYSPTGGNMNIPISYDGTIAQGQAFWVLKTTAGPAVITFKEADKNPVSNPPFIRESDENILRVNVAGNNLMDEMVIAFRDNASDAATDARDAFKMPNQSISLSSRSADNKNLAINVLGSVACARQVPISLNGVEPGSHKFTFSQLSSFDSGVNIRLVDSFTGETFVVSEGNNIYNFDVTADENSFGSNRFKAYIGYSDINLNSNVQAQAICSGNDAQVTIMTPQTGVSYFASLNGTTISSEVVATNGTQVTVSIPKANLLSSNNVITLMAKNKGCEALPLTNKAIVEVKNMPSTPAVTNAGGCGEGTYTLNASGAPSDGSYRWYLTEDATDPIDGQTASSFTTPSLVKTKTYFVSAVNSLGCEGGRTAVTATITYQEDASITVEGNTLISSSESGNQWYLDNVEIPGADKKSFDATESGTYTLVVSSGECKNSVARTFAVTGDIDKESSQAYVTYPSPTEGVIYVEVAAQSEVEVSIKNSIGLEITRGVLKQEGSIRKGHFDITGNATGIYLVVIKHDNQTVIKKIVKK